MTRHLLTSGLFAGFAVALLATLLHLAFLERNIALAERYESGALEHFAGAGHDHAASADQAEAHDHAPPVAPLWQRQAKTLLTMIITYCGYGLLMTAALALAARFGASAGPRDGLLWGLAGFTAFALAPAMGLEPALPGLDYGPLQPRQIWWLGCAAATLAGLALLAFGSGARPRIAGLAILALPHLIGAPVPAAFTGILPPELAARHAARSLGVGLVAWLSLGGLTQWFWSRPR